MVFWIVFSVIHILATLLLSTQLYYMGRWKLGNITARQNLLQGTFWVLWVVHFSLSSVPMCR